MGNCPRVVARGPPTVDARAPPAPWRRTGGILERSRDDRRGGGRDPPVGALERVRPAYARKLVLATLSRYRRRYCLDPSVDFRTWVLGRDGFGCRGGKSLP